MTTLITKYTLIALILFASLFFLNVRPTKAQSVSLSITPPLVELLIKPGKSVLVAYTVSNNGDPVVLTSNVNSFVPKGTNGNINLVGEILGPVRFGLDNADIALGKGVFLKSHDKQQFLLKIRVPENASPGDYYYTFFVKTDPGPLFTSENISKSTVVLGSNILVTVSNTGLVESKARIVHFDLKDSAKFNFFGRKLNIIESTSQIPLDLVIANLGNNLIKPQGEIVLHGPLGVLSRHTVTPVNILAKSSRLVPATPSASLNCLSNNQLCKEPLSFLLKGFFIGKHSLGATITFGKGSSPIYASVSFFAVPLRLIGVLLITIIISFVLVRRIRQTREIETDI